LGGELAGILKLGIQEDLTNREKQARRKDIRFEFVKGSGVALW